MHPLLTISKKRILLLIVVCLSLLLFMELAIGYYLIRHSSLSRIASRLRLLTERVQSDIKYSNGMWDMSAYNADPLTPHPSGSGGFSQPLYIVTTDGFVIERTIFISGLLDTADFKRLVGYSTLQTIITPTNEKWRVLSKPIVNDGDTVAVILVSYYLPDKYNPQEVDNRLLDAIERLYTQIDMKQGTVDTSRIDVRNVYVDVTSEVVDKYNRVLFNNGRVPSFIDQSYVVNELQHTGIRETKDSRTGIPYYVYSKTLTDETGKVIGVVISGQSIADIQELLKSYLLYTMLLSVFLVVPLSLLGLYFINRELLGIHQREEEQKHNPSAITFNRSSGLLTVGKTHIIIPPNSYQFSLCDLLLSNPEKKWSLDDILKYIGSAEADSWKTVYDAHLAINRKAGTKLIVYYSKMYQLNPKYVAVVKRH